MHALVDAVGTRHERVAARARIVSLVPSLTELLCDLGLADDLVGRTRYCIHPRDAVAGIPKVGGTKDVDLDRVRRLAPTHVVLNVDENTRDTAQALAAFVPRLIVTHPLGPLDNPELFRLLGGIFGRERAAEQLCAAFEQQLEAATRTSRVPQRVLYLIWRKPWMTVGPDTYVSRTLALFGWQTQPEEPADARYPIVDPASFAGTVDRVLLASEPYRFRPHHAPEIEGLLPGTPVEPIDGEMTSWYGSRAIQALRYLDTRTRA